ncbi:hypothetical protein HK098_005681 [Nowakowskiella sp. JEL0407]|nr:hypothetical protein HK098_005681 [Nowakowskiella sp. JEL0407]
MKISQIFTLKFLITFLSLSTFALAQTCGKTSPLVGARFSLQATTNQRLTGTLTVLNDCVLQLSDFFFVDANRELHLTNGDFPITIFQTDLISTTLFSSQLFQLLPGTQLSQIKRVAVLSNGFVLGFANLNNPITTVAPPVVVVTTTTSTISVPPVTEVPPAVTTTKPVTAVQATPVRLLAPKLVFVNVSPDASVPIGVSYNLNNLKQPNITLVRGTTYTFGVIAGTPHPFYLTSSNVGAKGANPGTTEKVFAGNSTTFGTSEKPGYVTFTPDSSTPNSLFYQCWFHGRMGGAVTIVDPKADGKYDVDVTVNNSTLPPTANIVGSGSSKQHGVGWMMIVIAVVFTNIKEDYEKLLESTHDDKTLTSSPITPHTNTIDTTPPLPQKDFTNRFSTPIIPNPPQQQKTKHYSTPKPEKQLDSVVSKEYGTKKSTLVAESEKTNFFDTGVKSEPAVLIPPPPPSSSSSNTAALSSFAVASKQNSTGFANFDSISSSGLNSNGSESAAIVQNGSMKSGSGYVNVPVKSPEPELTGVKSFDAFPIFEATKSLDTTVSLKSVENEKQFTDFDLISNGADVNSSTDIFTDVDLLSGGTSTVSNSSEVNFFASEVSSVETKSIAIKFESIESSKRVELKIPLNIVENKIKISATLADELKNKSIPVPLETELAIPKKPEDAFAAFAQFDKSKQEVEVKEEKKVSLQELQMIQSTTGNFHVEEFEKMEMMKPTANASADENEIDFVESMANFEPNSGTIEESLLQVDPAADPDSSFFFRKTENVLEKVDELLNLAEEVVDQETQSNNSDDDWLQGPMEESDEVMRLINNKLQQLTPEREYLDNEPESSALGGNSELNTSDPAVIAYSSPSSVSGSTQARFVTPTLDSNPDHVHPPPPRSNEYIPNIPLSPLKVKHEMCTLQYLQAQTEYSTISLQSTDPNTEEVSADEYTENLNRLKLMTETIHVLDEKVKSLNKMIENCEKNYIMSFTSKEISQQILVWSVNVLKELDLPQIQAYFRNPQSVPAGLIRTMDFSYYLKRLVQMTIITPQDANSRAKYISQWCDVLYNLLQLRDYQSCRAVLLALNSKAVQRLTITWNFVARNHRMQFKLFNKWKNILGDETDFKEYKEVIFGVEFPLVPLIDVLVQDLKTECEEMGSKGDTSEGGGFRFFQHVINTLGHYHTTILPRSAEFIMRGQVVSHWLFTQNWICENELMEMSERRESTSGKGVGRKGSLLPSFEGRKRSSMSSGSEDHGSRYKPPSIGKVSVEMQPNEKMKEQFATEEKAESVKKEHKPFVPPPRTISAMQQVLKPYEIKH